MLDTDTMYDGNRSSFPKFPVRVSWSKRFQMKSHQLEEHVEANLSTQPKILTLRRSYLLHTFCSMERVVFGRIVAVAAMG